MTELVRAIHSNISVNTSVRVFLDLKNSELFPQYNGREAGSTNIRIPRSFKHAI